MFFKKKRADEHFSEDSSQSAKAFNYSGQLGMYIYPFRYQTGTLKYSYLLIKFLFKETKQKKLTLLLQTQYSYL